MKKNFAENGWGGQKKRALKKKVRFLENKRDSRKITKGLAKRGKESIDPWKT